MIIKRITDQKEIKAILHAYMLKPKDQVADFIPVIFTREHRPGGDNFVGYRPLRSSTDSSGETNYTLEWINQSSTTHNKGEIE